MMRIRRTKKKMMMRMMVVVTMMRRMTTCFQIQQGTPSMSPFPESSHHD